MSDPNFAIPGLMRIESPREEGFSCAPLTQQDFSLRGVMEMQTPVMEFQATGTMMECQEMFASLINESYFGDAELLRTAPLSGFSNAQEFGSPRIQRPLYPAVTSNVNSFGDLQT